MSPQDGKLCSSHEGEVVLRISNSAIANHLSRKDFGEAMIGLLTVDGKVLAWKRLQEPGYFHMIAEFADVSSVPRAIARLNNQEIGVSDMLFPLHAMANRISGWQIFTERYCSRA